VDLFDEWATKTPERIAAEWKGETLTYSGLRNASLHVSRALLSAGVVPGAKIPVLTNMSLEMLPAIIGVLRVGACYAPMDVVAWSHSRIEFALSTLSSEIAVVTSPCPGLQLPIITVNFQRQWLNSPLENDGELCAKLNALRDGFREDDLAWILFTSGTTGKPKGVMVYHKSAYAYSMVQLMGDETKEEETRCLLAFSVGFDGCASVVWTALTKGHTLVMASSSNFPEAAATCDALMLTPSMLALLDPSGPYYRVRYILMGAEDPSMEVVRQWITPNRRVFTTYGPTETTCIITLGELKPDGEITLGNLLPGVKVVLVDENLRECDHGEVLIAGPGLAAGYMNRPELTEKKFIQWNGERFYRTGDIARRTKNGQLQWAGRADSQVKNRGFLINLETEVEPALLSFPPVRTAVALQWRDKLVGYVLPANIDVEKLREFMKERFDSFIIPDEILAMDSFPLNFNGKIDRHALTARLEERMTEDSESFSHDGPLSPHDTLRLAFSRCLYVPMKELDRESSFTRLGGNSFIAIRVSNLLKKHGYFISAIQILRRDTIGSLEEGLEAQTNYNGSEQETKDSDTTSGVVHATPSQRVFLTRSLQYPLQCALIGITKYTGDPLTIPTASELHNVFIKALSAHSIFQTRFDLTNFTLHDLGRLNLNWQEVSVREADFDRAVVEAEEKAWSAMNEVGQPEVEVPYFHVTCISVPGRKALAYITRIHHVLMDVVSQSVLSEDIERALAGEEISPGPKIEDLARFMHKYEVVNMPTVTARYTRMLEPLPATSVLQVPSPKKPALNQIFDLVRLDSPTFLAKAALDASARDLRVTTSTMVYAAWALFLHRITTWNHVGFRISLSGRMIPWPAAQSVVGCLVDAALFCTSVPTHLTVHEWLAAVHRTTLDVLEFEGLAFALPESMRADPRANTTNVLCFLDVPEPSNDRWTYSEKQKHNYLMDWYVYKEGESVASKFEIPTGRVDLDWAREVAGMPGRILNEIVNATKETLVADLLT
jgi:amino acid adenylation domain-containing protein